MEKGSKTSGVGRWRVNFCVIWSVFFIVFFLFSMIPMFLDGGKGEVSHVGGADLVLKNGEELAHIPLFLAWTIEEGTYVSKKPNSMTCVIGGVEKNVFFWRFLELVTIATIFASLGVLMRKRWDPKA